MTNSKRSVVCRTALLSVLAVALVFCGSSMAAVISFNAVGGGGSGMSATDTAGAPNANVAYWNNMVESNPSSGSVPYTFNGSIPAGSVIDDSGAILPGTSVSWNFMGVAGNPGGSGSNDQRMFDPEWDPFSGSPDLTISVSNIPFAEYQVITYHHSAIYTAQDRGGDVTANGVTKALRMFQLDADNPNGTFGYVEADFDGTFDTGTPTNVPRGTYVHFDETLSGDLTLTVDAKYGARLRFSGFQIVQVPEPTTLLTWSLLATLGIAFGWRRRKR